MDFHSSFIEIPNDLTGFLMDLHWKYIEVSTGFPKDSHWYLNFKF